ncbi:hypothetical protein ABW19_dt0205830 [Dactylella cylindrospora]|nr:hypothetical protein ABW19_dt0205830 [Dactylella cylindrospora]
MTVLLLALYTIPDTTHRFFCVSFPTGLHPSTGVFGFFKTGRRLHHHHGSIMALALLYFGTNFFVSYRNSGHFFALNFLSHSDGTSSQYFPVGIILPADGVYPSWHQMFFFSFFPYLLSFLTLWLFFLLHLPLHTHCALVLSHSYSGRRAWSS